MRSRAELEEFIKKGNSVQLPDGRRVTRVEDLPSEAVLAAGDRDRLKAEHDRLTKVADDAAKERDDVKRKLDAADQAAGTATKADAKEKAAEKDDEDKPKHGHKK